jgi:hypothetical protein
LGKSTLKKQDVSKTLSLKHVELIKNQKALRGVPGRRPAKNSTERGSDGAIRAVAKKEISDLTFLAANLNEKQQGQIFNVSTLNPLFDKLFSALTDDLKVRSKSFQATGKGEALTKEEFKELQKRKERIIELCYNLLNIIGLFENAEGLAPDEWRILNGSGNTMTASVKGVTAIYLKGQQLQNLPKRHQIKNNYPS